MSSRQNLGKENQFGRNRKTNHPQRIIFCFGCLGYFVRNWLQGKDVTFCKKVRKAQTLPTNHIILVFQKHHDILLASLKTKDCLVFLNN